MSDHSTFTHNIMPLVVPGLMGNDKGKNEDWNTQLMGKKLGDSHNETVCQAYTAS